MARSKNNQRQSRLSNPVAATKMYEALTKAASMRYSADFESIISVIDEALDFVRNGEVSDMAVKAEKTEKTEKTEGAAAELSVASIPTRYTVRLGVKIPSKVEQYRNMEANVAVSSNDPDEAMEVARQQFVRAVVTVCNTMGEVPPDEIRPSVEEIFTEDTSLIYGEGE